MACKPEDDIYSTVKTKKIGVKIMQVSAYEQMKTKIHASELFHKKQFSQEIRNTTAVVLKNTLAVFEGIEGTFGANSTVAQTNPTGSYKNFIIKVATLGIPALDVFDWVAVESMATANSQVLFTRYLKLSNKGTSKQGDIVADPFGIYYRQNADGTRENAIDSSYNGELTSDPIVVASSGTQTGNLRWTPVREGSLIITIGGVVATEATGAAATADSGFDYSFVSNAITVNINRATGAYKIAGATVSAEDIFTVVYRWDNKYLPANDMPTFGAKVEAIPLVAKPHKLRIVFDALDNLIYKNDYNIDISKELPKKAVEDFMFSVAMQVSDKIVSEAPTSQYTMPFSLAAPNGWVAQHFAAFGLVLNAAAAAITKVTNIYAGNRCFIGSALVPVVMGTPGWKAADTEGKIGTQLLGSIGNIKIYFKPNMNDYEYVVWSKGQGTELSVGVLGIYIAALPASIIPTQLLEFADGLNSQGFYSLYDYIHLNPHLSVKGRVSH